MTQPQLDAYLIRVTDLIAEHGWMIQGVFGTENDPTAFSYTVGLTESEKPELFLDTLSPKQSQPILNAAARAVHDGTLVPKHGVIFDIDYSVRFKWRGPISTRAAELGMCHRLYVSVEAYQVLWPDTEGRYPDDDGYDAKRFPQRLVDLA